MALLPLPTDGRNVKRYILAGLTAIIVAAALVIVVSVVMSPAHVSFSIARADRRRLSGGSSVQLNFTIAANNTSRRAAVMYRSMFVDVSNSTQWASWVRADVTTPTPVHQPTRNVTFISASVWMSSKAFVTNATASDFAVMITAVVRFQVGIARTSLYDIKVSCEPIDFFSAAWPVQCQVISSL